MTDFAKSLEKYIYRSTLTESQLAKIDVYKRQGQTFRAGTIGTLAEKTAYGYARGYFEDHQIEKRSCELTRLASGCVGVRRTTGQHPVSYTHLKGKGRQNSAGGQ